MDKDNLATELLKELKAQSKRWFIAFIICLILLFTSNIAWLIMWNIPTQEVEVQSDNQSNAIYNEEGDVQV